MTATCAHGTRKAFRRGLCRECHQVTGPPDDPLPAHVFRAEQRGGEVTPSVCGKCGGAWLQRAGYVSCYACGATWHTTSARIIAQPAPAPGGRGRARVTPEWEA